MSEKTKPNCKHEKFYEDSLGEVHFCCVECNDEYLGEVVIRTKAHDKAREDVIAAAKGAWISLKGTDTMNEFNGQMRRIKEALDALGGE